MEAAANYYENLGCLSLSLSLPLSRSVSLSLSLLFPPSVSLSLSFSFSLSLALVQFPSPSLPLNPMAWGVEDPGCFWCYDLGEIASRQRLQVQPLNPEPCTPDPPHLLNPGS